MPWDTTELCSRFSKKENNEVLAYLLVHHPSSHSDVAEELYIATLPFEKKLITFCPNPSQYAYVLYAAPNRTIFGLTIGMKTLLLRLPSAMIPDAQKEGAELFPEIGSSWVWFDPFLVEVPTDKMREKLNRWAKSAYYGVLNQDSAGGRTSR
jgi:hypothetical protein